VLQIRYSSDSYTERCHHFSLPSHQHCKQVARLACLQKHPQRTLLFCMCYQMLSPLWNYTPLLEFPVAETTILNRCMTIFNTLYLSHSTFVYIVPRTETFRFTTEQHFYHNSILDIVCFYVIILSMLFLLYYFQ